MDHNLIKSIYIGIIIFIGCAIVINNSIKFLGCDEVCKRSNRIEPVNESIP